MSIGPWNTGTGGAAVCEDMPRKSIDIKLSEYPVQQKREHCALFLPSGEDGSGQSPGVSQRADSLRVCTAILWALGEPFGIYICNFQGSFEPIFYGLFFIDYLTLPSVINQEALYSSLTLFHYSTETKEIQESCRYGFSKI